MPHVLTQTDSEATASNPLCVDLDGTLVKSDTLVDSLLVMARNSPLLLLRLPGQLLRGKAAFKAFVTTHVELDVAHLPYNRKLLQFLQEQHAGGREVYLTHRRRPASLRKESPVISRFSTAFSAAMAQPT